MSYAVHFLERTLQRFASKILLIDSKAIEKFKHLRFCANIGKIENFHVFLKQIQAVFCTVFELLSCKKWLEKLNID